ncbi:hypothetical protein FNV43_RR04380 [Rhamnella rubrinervis]|uniref:Uncharacterized protein n=1 Tax=Rhamnella rubrinervis TaxID=2594499 RepID=A0A8K0HKL5_9ROSA|nr:hypothetical protein FNV43_RR04380 [Rhamnella rubrinervis]
MSRGGGGHNYFPLYARGAGAQSRPDAIEPLEPYVARVAGGFVPQNNFEKSSLQAVPGHKGPPRITLDLAMDSNNTNKVLNRALDSNKKLESAFVVTKQKKLKVKAEAWIWKTKLALFEETLKSIKAGLQATVSS